MANWGNFWGEGLEWDEELLFMTAPLILFDFLKNLVHIYFDKCLKSIKK